MHDNKRTKILILSVGAGSGHKTAAFALAEAFAELKPMVSITHLEVLDLAKFKITNKIFLSNTNSFLLSPFYDFFWNSKFFSHLIKPLDFLLTKNYKGNLIRSIQATPDIVISTHAFAALLSLNVKAIRYAVTTDFRTHSYWPISGIKTYFVANEETRQDLLKSGAKGQFCISGIPVRKQFYEIQSTKKPKKKKPNILILGGAYEKGPYKTISKKIIELILVSVKCNCGVTIVCGKDIDLKDPLDLFVKKMGLPNVRPLGFIEKISKIILSHDLIISKPGGLILSEILALGKIPIIFALKSSGQEKQNKNLLLSHNAAFLLKKSGDLEKIIKKWERDDGRIQINTQNITKISKPKAALTIRDHIILDQKD